jgi:hypothetical protein
MSQLNVLHVSGELDNTLLRGCVNIFFARVPDRVYLMDKGRPDSKCACVAARVRDAGTHMRATPGRTCARRPGAYARGDGRCFAVAGFY